MSAPTLTMPQLNQLCTLVERKEERVMNYEFYRRRSRVGRCKPAQRLYYRALQRDTEVRLFRYRSEYRVLTKGPLPRT